MTCSTSLMKLSVTPLICHSYYCGKNKSKLRRGIEQGELLHTTIENIIRSLRILEVENLDTSVIPLQGIKPNN